MNQPFFKCSPQSANSSRFSALLKYLSLIVCCLPAVDAAEPTKIILDTDFRGDCDDVGALAVAHRLMDLGEAELIGVVTSTTGPSIVGAIDSVNHYYGRPDIPIGLSAVENTISGGGDQYAPTLADTSRYPSDQTNASAPDSTTLYRQLLHQSSEPVTIVVVGYFGAVAHFMNSPADYQGDGIPYTGMELIEAKVHELVLMAGAFNDPNKVVANAMWDYPSTFDVMDHWPTEIIFSGWEIGRAAWTGGGLSDPANNPVAKAYELYGGTVGGAGVIGDRPSYDLAAVIQAIRGEYSDGERMWRLSEPGTVTISDSSPYTSYVAHADGRHHYQILEMDANKLKDIIETLLIAQPGSPLPGTVEPVGLVAAYNLAEGSGLVAADSSGYGSALDLSLQGDATWVKNGVHFAGNGRLQADDASKISQRIKATNRLSIEAWFQPDILDQEGPARLVTISADGSNRNVTLGHGYYQDANNALEVRLRTSASDINGRPALEVDDALDTELQQVVVTYDGSNLSVYRNGVLLAQESRDASLQNWDPNFALALGGEVGGIRGWTGTLFKVRIFDRDLSLSEIQQSHAAGPTGSDPEPGLMTDLQVNSGRPVEVGELAVGARMYSDRDAVFDVVPAALLGLEYLRTPNDDKTNASDDYLTFTLNENAMLFVGFDDRGTPSAWLSSWTLTDDKLNQDAWVRRLYKKWHPAGTVVLGGNGQTSDHSNYTVIAMAEPVELTVNSEFGTPVPTVSSHSFRSGSSIAASVEDYTEGLTRYIVTGWTGTGSVPATGSSNSVNFTITEDSSITWHWQTEEGLETDGETALLVRDSVIDPTAHYFPQITYGVPTVHGVTFQQEGVLTHKGWQYAAYYNAQGHVSLGRRHLPDGDWETLTLTDYRFTRVDSHNSVVLGICAGDGTVHLSFDHHNHPLNYRVSVPEVVDDPESVAWTPALFGPIRDRLTDTTISSLTYPRFIAAPGGKLLFTCRVGGSGNGDSILYEYDGASGAWTRIGVYISKQGTYNGRFTASSSSRNPYIDNNVFDHTGRLHITWCWRELSNPRSNHDIFYAYSDDLGRTWKNQHGVEVGETGASPLRVDTPGLRVWEIPQNRNYINNSGMTVDAEGRVHVLAWHYPDSVPDQTSDFDVRITSPARYHHYWRDLEGVWHRNPTDLTGSRAKLVADSDGHLFAFYGDAENLQIAMATPAAAWSDWREMNLTGALPSGMGAEVNAIYDPVRWLEDGVLSIYAQERTSAGGSPKPLHLLDYHVSKRAVLPVPVNDAVRVPLDVMLAWTPGRGAVSHDVYVGTSQEAVEAADRTSPEFRGSDTIATHQLDGLSPQTAYYWRIDAVDAGENVTRGPVWTFETRSLQPSVRTGSASRVYGGGVLLEGELLSAAGDPAEIILYWGTADGGTDPGAWPHSVSLGEQAAGSIAVEISTIGEDAATFRFFAVNEHGAEWSPEAGQWTASENLAHWKHSAELMIEFGESLEPLHGFPVLFRLDPAQIEGFSPDSLLSPPYGDLRFSDLSGNEIYPYEVEAWHSDGSATLWVRIPVIDGPTPVRMWWGREGRQTPVPAEQAAVWSERFAGVWHLDEALGFGVDSSPQAVTSAAVSLSSADTAIASGAARLNGSTSTLQIDNSNALNPNHITLEAWISTTQSGTASIVSKDNSAGGGAGRVWQFRLVDGKLEFIVFSAVDVGSLAGTTMVADGQWRHVAATWDGQTLRLFVDGALEAEAPFSGTLRAGQNNDVFIGRMQTNDPGYFQGDIDEVRISDTARSPDWIRASWRNQRSASDAIEWGNAGAPDLDDDLLPDLWEMQHFETIHAADGRGDSAVNGHGLSDLLAFATGVDPSDPNGSIFLRIQLMPTDALPTLTYDQIANGDGTVGVDYSAAGLRYSAEFSLDLIHWLSGHDYVEFTGVRQPLPAGMERVTVRFLGDGAGAPTVFFGRLRVMADEP